MENGKYLTLKLQLYPNGTMKHLMDRSIEVSGYVYNAFIYVGIYYRKNYNRFPSKNDLRGLCTKFWKNCPWMHDVANNCFFECADNAIRALKDCYENYKKNKGGMLPHYRKRDNFSCFGHLSCVNFNLINESINGKLRRSLYLRKIGNIRARNNQEEPPGIPKTCHIKRDTVGNHQEYSATISYKIDSSYSKDELNLESPFRSPQGIDIGISDVATLSDGTRYLNQKFQIKFIDTIKKLHRQLSSAPLYSNEFNKIQGKLNHLYRKIHNKRRDYTNKISKEIVYSNGQLYAESVSIDQLKKIAYSHKMRLQYNDACIGQLMKRIDVLSNDAKRPIQYVEFAYTSQECCICGNIVKKKLEERIHHCPACGLNINRDQNAAINILLNGLACNPAHTNNSENCTRLESSSDNYTLINIKKWIGPQSIHYGKTSSKMTRGSNSRLNIYNLDVFSHKNHESKLIDYNRQTSNIKKNNQTNI